MKKSFFYILLILIVACHHHDETGEAYVVNIQILKPDSGQRFAKNTAIPVDVLITRDHDATIHHVKIESINTTVNTTDVLTDRHYHSSGEVHFTSSDYIPKASGNITLRVTSTNDEKLEPNTKEINFIIN